jgi:hypothetical protein
VFDHLEFFRFRDWHVVISQPYRYVEDGVGEELTSLAYQHYGEFSVLPEWSYCFPGHTILILFLFPPLPLKRVSGPMHYPHHLSLFTYFRQQATDDGQWITGDKPVILWQ